MSLAPPTIRHPYDHHLWTCRFLACELLCLAHVILQFHLTNVFLDGAFTHYGLQVVVPSSPQVAHRLWSHSRDVADPMLHVFPKMTKCDLLT